MVSPSTDRATAVYDVLEATVKAAIQFTKADAGHIFLIKRNGDQVLVSHQCMITESGTRIQQYQADRPERFGPCSRAIGDGKMYYVHDCTSNTLHQRLLADLRRIRARSESGTLKERYLLEYITFLTKAQSYIAVPIRTIDGVSIGCIGLYSYYEEDYFGTMEKRIIEEYMNNFASSLILTLIDKARHEDTRMQDLLPDGHEDTLLGRDLITGGIFDNGDASDFRGVGLLIESVFRRTSEFESWNHLIQNIERVLINFALKRSEGRPGRAYRWLKMPKRTFYHKLKKLKIDEMRSIRCSEAESIDE